MKRLLAASALLAFLTVPATLACADGWYRNGTYRYDARHEHVRNCGHIQVDGVWFVDVRGQFDRSYHHCRYHSSYHRFCRRCREYAYYWKLQHHPNYERRWEEVDWRRRRH